jgi:hypothetical protein
MGKFYDIQMDEMANFSNLKFFNFAIPNFALWKIRKKTSVN